MPTLAFDTATEVLAIALGDGDNVLAELSLDAGRSHLELLLPNIHEMLGREGLSIRDLDSIVVGLGPGSFSGLRIGISTARGLAQALKLPLSGFRTLEALALGISTNSPEGAGSMILPLVDAKRGQVFAQLYKKEGDGEVVAESEVFCVYPDSLPAKLKAMTGIPILAGGSGAVVYREVLAPAAQLDLLRADDNANQVRACWLLRSAPPGNFDARRLVSVLPAYVREPDADKTILLRKQEQWLR